MRYWLLLALLLMPTTAWSLDLGAPLQTVDGNPAETCLRLDETATPPKCAQKVPLTVGRAIATVLLTPSPDDKKADVVELAERGTLARKILDAKEPIDLDASAIVMIRSRLPMSGYNPYLIAQILDVIEPNHKTNPVKTEDVKPPSQ